jgi:hypothetical protein
VKVYSLIQVTVPPILVSANRFELLATISHVSRGCLFKRLVDPVVRRLKVDAHVHGTKIRLEAFCFLASSLLAWRFKTPIGICAINSAPITRADAKI